MYGKRIKPRAGRKPRSSFGAEDMRESTFMLLFNRDARECRKDGDYFVHVLNSAFAVHKDDARILSVRPIHVPVVLPARHDHQT